MKVILIKRVPGLGEADAIKEVANGYAHNFLFPRHLAVEASRAAEEAIQFKRSRSSQEARLELERQQKLASSVDGLELEIADRASAAGILYAALTPERLSAALRQRGYNISKEQIITKPLKQVGSHAVKIKFRHGLEAEITVVINK